VFKAQPENSGSFFETQIGANFLREVGAHNYDERGSRAYNGDLGVQGQRPWSGVRG